MGLNKNAQISIFVIISIILVIIAVFLVANSQFDIFVPTDVRLKNQISTIVQDCVYDFGTSGVFFLGYQGGYIQIPSQIEFDRDRFVDFGLKIPNWDSDFGSIPTISSMERELEVYVEEEASLCIVSNLDALEESFDFTYNEDDIEVDAEINLESVSLEVYFPITFNEKNSPEVLSVGNYLINIESTRLGDMFDLAKEIYLLEEQNLFVEDLVLDQIYSANDYSSTDSVPTEGMYFSCGGRVWSYPQLKENIANLNNNNFKYIYFDGTYPIDDLFDANLNPNFNSEEYRQYYEKNYFFELQNNKNSFENYRVEIMMPSTEITGLDGIIQRYPFRNFEVTPSSGEIVKSLNFNVEDIFEVAIPCVQLYHHLYNLDYDLIVKLTDYSEDGGEFTFQFPIRVQIENNEPKASSYISPIAEQNVDIRFNDRFCSEEEKIYPARVFVSDNYGNYLDNVNVSYKCVALSCDLGFTEKPSFNGILRTNADPYYEGNFPYCIGGKIVAEKEGYHTSELRVDTDETLIGREPLVNFDLEMIPLKSFEIDVSSFLVVNREDNLGSRVYNESQGSIFVSIESNEYGFETNVIWPNNGDYFNQLELLDEEGVKYNVSVFYADSNLDLKGLLDMKNVELDPNLGNSIEFVIPGSKEVITADDYTDFYDYILFAQQSGTYGVFVR